MQKTGIDATSLYVISYPRLITSLGIYTHTDQ